MGDPCLPVAPLSSVAVRSGMPKMVRFDELGGIPCYYARVNAGYGDLARTTGSTEKARTRQLAPSFKRQMDAALAEVYWLTSGLLGPLKALVSGGAYVDKPGWHRKGRAFDLGGLHWEGGRLVLIRTASEVDFTLADDWGLYLGVEAILRRHFGTVLGILHDKRHHNHWHIDPGTPVGYWTTGFGAKTRVTYLQACLSAIWGTYDGALDGDHGPVTKKALAETCGRLAIGPLDKPENWTQFLLLTAAAGIQTVG